MDTLIPYFNRKNVYLQLKCGRIQKKQMAPEKGFQIQDRTADKKPHNRIGQTNLSFPMIIVGRIIPYLSVKIEIKYQPKDQFHKKNEKSTEDHSGDQMKRRGVSSVQTTDQIKDDPSAQKHTVMGKSTKDDFQPIIDESAKTDKKECFCDTNIQFHSCFLPVI